MNKSIVTTALTMICFVNLGCATMSNRTKTILTTAGAAAVGGGVGYFTAPEGTLPIAHAGLWAGISAAVTGVASLFLFDSEKEKQGLQDSNRKLDIEIRELKASIEPQLVEEVPEAKLSNLPSEIAKLVGSGVYRRFMIAPKFGGIWVKEKAGNTWYKRSQMLLYTKGEMMGDTSEPLNAALNQDESQPKPNEPALQNQTSTNPPVPLPSVDKQTSITPSQVGKTEQKPLSVSPPENKEGGSINKEKVINNDLKGGDSN